MKKPSPRKVRERAGGVRVVYGTSCTTASLG